MERKICHKCRNEKSVSEFYKDPSGKRGYRAVCKDCANERRRAKNWGRKRHSFKRGGNDARYWRVVYDPLDTFTNNSAFTKNEIIDMLNLEFLAIGTMFRHKRTGKMIMVGTNDKLVMVDEMITIELPWPDKRLSPNAREHWAAKAKATRIAKHLAFGLAWNFKSNDLPNWIKAHYIFCPPDKYKRDIDNCLAMMKPYQDGVCNALSINDGNIKKTVIEWGEVVKGGKVILELGAIE